MILNEAPEVTNTFPFLSDFNFFDMDGDFDLDLIANYRTNDDVTGEYFTNFFQYENLINNVIGDPQALLSISQDTTIVIEFFPTDFDNDGDGDLFVLCDAPDLAEADPHFKVFENINGSLTYMGRTISLEEEPFNLNGAMSNVRVTTPEDIDLDGIADLCFSLESDQGYTIFVLKYLGEGNFEFLTSIGSEDGIWSLELADPDNDFDWDIFYGTFSGDVFFAENTLSTSFMSLASSKQSESPSLMSIGSSCLTLFSSLVIILFLL